MTERKWTDANALDWIAGSLDGKEWDAETVEIVADFVRGTGREIGEPQWCDACEDNHSPGEGHADDVPAPEPVVGSCRHCGAFEGFDDGTNCPALMNSRCEVVTVACECTDLECTAANHGAISPCSFRTTDPAWLYRKAGSLLPFCDQCAVLALGRDWEQTDPKDPRWLS